MRKWFVTSMVVILLLGNLAGCAAPDIRQRGIVAGISLARTKHGNYTWTFLFPNVMANPTSLVSISPLEMHWSVVVQAPTLPAAFSQVNQHLSRDIYLGQIRSIAVSTSLNARTLTLMLNDIVHVGTINNDMWMAASDKNPQLLMTVPSPQVSCPCLVLSKYFECRSCQPYDLRMRAWRAWDRSQTPGVSIMMPMTVATKVGVFANQMAVWGTTGPAHLMTPKETLGWAYLRGKVLKGVLTWRSAEGGVSLDRLEDHVKVKVGYQHGHVAVSEKVTVNGYVAQTPVALTSSMLTKMDNIAARRILARCLQAIHFANRTHTDPFGYTRELLWKDPGELSALHLGRQEVLPIDAHVSVKVKLTGEG